MLSVKRSAVQLGEPPLTETLALLSACAAGKVEARRRFLDLYERQIYDFATQGLLLSEDDAQSYYLYLFEHDRLFKRIRTFEGRNGAPFLPYLKKYPLLHLFIEWRRTVKPQVKSTSLDAPMGGSDGAEDDRTLHDQLADPTAVIPGAEDDTDTETGSLLWDALSPEERLYFKLFHLLQYDLSPEEVGLLAHLSRRSVIDTLTILAEVQDSLRRKDEKAARLRDALDSVQGWIRLRQEELQAIDEILHPLTQMRSVQVLTLSRRKQELEHAIAKRYRQRARLLKEIGRQKLTTPHRDMARLLNIKQGTASSLLSRLYDRLARWVKGNGEEKEPDS